MTRRGVLLAPESRPKMSGQVTPQEHPAGVAAELLCRRRSADGEFDVSTEPWLALFPSV